MKTNDLIKTINEICPEDIQEEWDNSGWQIKNEKEEISKVLVALEVTSETIQEAIDINADLMITHHPLFFVDLKVLDFTDVIGKFVRKLIKNDIGVYSCHTNFDIVEGGLNDYFGNLLGVDRVEAKYPGNKGILRYGYYNSSRSVRDIVEVCADKLKVEKNNFKLIGDFHKNISKIGICTGAGADFIRESYDDGCDLLITGDVKYHDARNAKELGMTVLDVGHYGSEKVFPNAFLKLIKKRKLDGVNFTPSDKEINPFEAL